MISSSEDNIEHYQTASNVNLGLKWSFFEYTLQKYGAFVAEYLLPVTVLIMVHVYAQLLFIRINRL